MVKWKNKKPKSNPLPSFPSFHAQKIQDWSDPASASPTKTKTQWDQGPQTVVQCIHGCANIQFPSGTPRSRLPSPPSLTELWIRCGVYKGTQSRSPKILFLPPWCPMATTWIGETQLLPFPSLWHYMVQTAFGPEFLGNPGFYSELIHSCCSEHSHCTRGWYLLQKPFWTISPDVDHPPCFSTSKNKLCKDLQMF